MAQTTAHETINAGCMAHNGAFSTITADQPDADCEEFLHQFHTEADQAWKDTNDIFLSHQLKYDAQLAAFITTAEETLQAKWDEIWSHVHSIMEAADLPNKACLSVALQILEKLPTFPLDLSYHTAILRMFAYCPESYAFQALSTTGDGDYWLDNCTWTASVLSSKLAPMAGRANLDGPNPDGAISPTGSAGSAVPCSPVCSPSHSHSWTPTKGEGRRSQSSSTSGLFSWGTQQESPTTSMPDEGSNGSSKSDDDSESNGKGEVGSDNGDSDSGGSSDDGSSSSNGSDSGEVSDDEGAQQGGSDNEGEGSDSEAEGSDA